LNVDTLCGYPEKQRELLKSNVLRILEEIYADAEDKQPINEFILKAASSISPKTRNMAKRLGQKYQFGGVNK
jgi:hypothetical protein